MRKSDVINHFGSVFAVAEALGVTSQAIGQWPETVPSLRQWQIEVLTGGKLKAQRKAVPQASA